MGRERRDEGREMVRKGPWKAEEDEILIHHVNKYGPRDWSSIRSKGLLLRTGKSCRLRWVNKLRPNLKSGVKFSAEEERVVIELQAQFGNKWARIARYLPGRTDNDVKNFWSSRQKRLARILQTTPTTPPPRSHRYTKTPTFHPLSTLEAAPNSIGSSTLKAESSSNIHTCSSSSSCSHVQTPDPIRMVPLPDLINPNSLDLDTQVEFNPTENDPNPSFEQPQLEAPILEFPHSQVLEDANFLEAFEGRDGCELGNVGRFSLGLPLPPLPSLAPEGCSGNKSGGKIDSGPITPDSFFDDFPTDMFDHIDPLPSLTDW